MKLRKYTEQQLRNAIQNSTSYRQALGMLGVVPAGGNYRTIQKAVVYFGLDVSHFNGQGWRRGRTFVPKRDIQEYLTNKHPIQSNKLRLRLIKENIFEHKCSCCNGIEWLGQPIPLELDHIDGNHQNNLLSNLRLLCPNCHAQTPTYRGRNKSS